MSKEKKPLIIAVDFDDTIVHTDKETFSIIGTRDNAVDVLKKWHQQQNIYIIIWTCRTNKTQYEAEAFLKANGITYDKVNDQSVYSKMEWPDACDSRKAYADIYIDDKDPKNVLWGLPTWKELDETVQLILERDKDKYATKADFNFNY